jgi:hypothetical protein
MEIELNPRWQPNKKKNGHLSPRSKTNIYHMPPSRPPYFFITHYTFKCAFIDAQKKYLQQYCMHKLGYKMLFLTRISPLYSVLD